MAPIKRASHSDPKWTHGQIGRSVAARQASYFTNARTPAARRKGSPDDRPGPLIRDFRSQVPGEISGRQIRKFPDTPSDRQTRDAMDGDRDFTHGSGPAGTLLTP